MFSYLWMKKREIWKWSNAESLKAGIFKMGMGIKCIINWERWGNTSIKKRLRKTLVLSHLEPTDSLRQRHFDIVLTRPHSVETVGRGIIMTNYIRNSHQNL